MLALFGSHRLTGLSGRFGVAIALLSAPFCLSASTVTVDFSINLAGKTGTGAVTYDPALVGTDAFGQFANQADGLQAFNLVYDGNTYTMADAIDSPTLPELFLPGNTFQPLPAGQYGFLGAWIVPGTQSGNFADVLAVNRINGSVLFTGLDVTTVGTTGSGSSLSVFACPNGTCPNLTITTGTLSQAPEPNVLPVLALGLLGLCFARRRKALVQ